MVRGYFVKQIEIPFVMAEGVGFEPTCPEGKRFSRHNNPSEIDGFCAMITDDKRS